MSDWQVGDLAIAVGGPDSCPACDGNEDDHADAPPLGSINCVMAVDTDQYYTGVLGLVGLEFAGHIWCSCGFRKVLPDKAEQCEPEFVTLLKRIKRPVPASTEPASEWLLRIAPLARRLNLESKFDTRQTRKEGDR